jgi:hypothetical protein
MFYSLASSREGRILEGKIRKYKKYSKIFLKILIMDRKFKKKNLVIFRTNFVKDLKIDRFQEQGKKS